MRPVTKQAPTQQQYAYGGIPVDSQQNLAAAMANNNVAPRWTFKAGGTVLRYFQGLNPAINQPTVWDCMSRVLLPVAQGNPSKAQTQAKVPIDGHATQTYQSAAAALGTQLGKSCSYCEQFLPGQIDVEHSVPKAPYPFFGIVWANLLLGCNACNGPTGKGSNPPRSELDNSASWQGYRPYQDEVARYNAIRGNAAGTVPAYYLWPDAAGAYTGLVPVLVYQAGQNWQLVPSADAVADGTAVTGQDLYSRTVTATINQTQNVNVRVVLKAPQGNDQARANNTFGLLQFGRMGNETPGKITDCRVFNRTLAWFSILAFARPLMKAAVNNDGNTFDFVWNMIAASAQKIGFFSVWVQVLGLLGGAKVQIPGIQQTVVNGFVNALNNSAGFPGTNANAVTPFLY